MLRTAVISAALAVGLPLDSYADICGAQCVHSVLRTYHQPTALSDLIDELNGVGLTRLPSLSDLAVSLRSRGIQAILVPLCEFSDLVWPYLAIVHIDGNHFAVVERRESTGAVQLRWTMTRRTTLSEPDFLIRSSGVVLLVSPGWSCAVEHEIRYCPRRSRLWPHPLLLYGTAVVAIACVCCVVNDRRRMRRTNRKIAVAPSVSPSTVCEVQLVALSVSHVPL